MIAFTVRGPSRRPTFNDTPSPPRELSTRAAADIALIDRALDRLGGITIEYRSYPSARIVAIRCAGVCR